MRRRKVSRRETRRTFGRNAAKVHPRNSYNPPRGGIRL